MDEQFERLASLDELNRWGRMARRFFPLLEPKVVTEPRPMLLVGGYEDPAESRQELAPNCRYRRRSGVMRRRKIPR